MGSGDKDDLTCVWTLGCDETLGHDKPLDVARPSKTVNVSRAVPDGPRQRTPIVFMCQLWQSVERLLLISRKECLSKILQINFHPKK